MRTRTRTAATVAIVAGLVAACAIGSPVALALADRWWRLDWRRLADIGQAYGAASAVFSALAVGGVAASIFYQARQLRLARAHAVRDTHQTLLSIARGNFTLYGPAIGLHHWRQTSMRPEQFYFITQYVGYLRFAFDSGDFSERDLQSEMLPDLFSGQMGRDWWLVARPDFLAQSDPMIGKFAGIVEAEYQKAVTSGPPRHPSGFIDTAPPASATQTSKWDTRIFAAATLAATAGWLAGRRRGRR